jgi:uncharacterized repeat protein (TIGR01451 family)
LEDGYSLVEAYCEGQEIETGETTLLDVVVGSETVNCTFINSPNGQIHGFKWDDANGDGQFSEENRLGGWTINLYKWDGEGWGDVLATTTTDSNEGENYGWYIFTHLFPGDYKVCEAQQGGWSQTFPGDDECHEFSLPNEQEQTENGILAPEYDFGNQEQIFGVNIEKSNDQGAGTVAGGTVNYKLVVTNSGNQTIWGLDVKDYLPGGFSYVLGTTTGDTTSDPTVTANNLTWENVTNLVGGSSFTINYQVKIADNVSTGTYKNYATCIEIGLEENKSQKKN